MRQPARVTAWPGRRVAKGAGLFAFGFYLWWNLHWLAQGALPPSIALQCLGVPAPTTGCTRSLRALLAGDVSLSLFWNPFLLPLLLLLGASGARLAWCAYEGLPLRLQRPLPQLWLGTLLAAFVFKVWQGPAAW
jgi:hypothetical protein